MSSFLKFQQHPYRFLLYTEWIMLASCASLALIETLEKQHLPVQHILVLGLLGIMGLRLPSGKPLGKVLYTVVEIGLVFYGTLLGYLHILPTLYLIVVIRSCFIFELSGRWAIAIFSFFLFCIHQVQYVYKITPLITQEGQHQFWMHQLSELLMFALGLIFVLKFVNTLLAERQMRQQLTSAHEQLRQYALQIEDLAAVQERNRIAREIHDSLGHALTALNVQLQTVGKLWQIDPTQARSFLTQAQHLGETAIKEVRQSVNTLRLDDREEETLESAIASLAEDFRQGSGISVSTQIDIEAILPSQLAKTLYRLVQEALTNICKHAQATKVEIRIRSTPERAYLEIEDNGRGFSLGSISSGFGLQGMRERVAALQGDFQLKTEPGVGCRIAVEFPLEEVLR